jgi:hypothetical protein
MSVLLSKIQDFRQKSARERQLMNDVLNCFLALEFNLGQLERAQQLAEKALTIAWQHRIYKNDDSEMIMLSNNSDEYERNQMKIPSKKVREYLHEIAQAICEENKEYPGAFDQVPETIKKMRIK